jgi:hypothetical protein
MKLRCTGRPRARSGSTRCGCASTVVAEPDSSMRPRFITATWSAMYSTTPMLWVMNTYNECGSRYSFFSRFRFCACTETSSADVGWSQTSSFGCTASARDGDALAMAPRALVRSKRYEATQSLLSPHAANSQWPGYCPCAMAALCCGTSGSRVMSVNGSHNAWTTSIRSNGALSIRGSRSPCTACAALTSAKR